MSPRNGDPCFSCGHPPPATPSPCCFRETIQWIVSSIHTLPPSWHTSFPAPSFSPGIASYTGPSFQSCDNRCIYDLGPAYESAEVMIEWFPHCLNNLFLTNWRSETVNCRGAAPLWYGHGEKHGSGHGHEHELNMNMNVDVLKNIQNTCFITSKYGFGSN